MREAEAPRPPHAPPSLAGPWTARWPRAGRLLVRTKGAGEGEGTSLGRLGSMARPGTHAACAGPRCTSTCGPGLEAAGGLSTSDLELLVRKLTAALRGRRRDEAAHACVHRKRRLNAHTASCHAGALEKWTKGERLAMVALLHGPVRHGAMTN